MARIDTTAARRANAARRVIGECRLRASGFLAVRQVYKPVSMTWLPDLGLRRILSRYRGSQGACYTANTAS